jgi:hypothetical protein
MTDEMFYVPKQEIAKVDKTRAAVVSSRNALIVLVTNRGPLMYGS